MTATTKTPRRKVPPRKFPAPADYSDEVTDEQLQRVKDLVPQDELEEAEEVCPPGW